MSSIYLKNLQTNPQSTDTVNSNYVFTDLYMDLTQDTETVMGKTSLSKAGKVWKKDLKVLHDESAIANSIFYIMNTLPGQRPLVPTFGCDLRKFIAQPITDYTTKMIQDTIFSALRTWEPRIKITAVEVEPNPEQHEYSIAVQAAVPKLSQPYINVFAKLTQSGELKRV